jgi:hypothetical protein
MSTPTHAVGTRLSALTEAWRAFLRECPLAEPALVSLEPTCNRISIQAGHHRDVLDRLGELLVWAYTLTRVSAQWWHTSDGSLHISIKGRASTGVALKVYGGIPFDHCAGLVQLAPDASESVSLDEIYTLLGLLREHRTTITGVAA